MLQNKEGQRIPAVTFRTRHDNQWKDVTTEQLFAGKTVIVFALPGAYTPTCSTTHLPRYNELAPAFSKLGVDEIVCLSVNDPFVSIMRQAIRDVYGQDGVIVPNMAATGPLYPFVTTLGLPTADCGIGYPDAAIHAPNENIRTEAFRISVGPTYPKVESIRIRATVSSSTLDAISDPCGRHWPSWSPKDCHVE